MFIVIDINSDLDPSIYPCDTASEIADAEIALRDAGLKQADVYVGDPDGSGDSHKNGQLVFAARQ